MTQLGKMPPWMPGHDSPAYLGQSQRLLTPGEKQLIARWVHGGAQIGKGGSVKPVGGGSKAPGTTMTLAPARAYLPKRAVGGLDDYHCFVLEPHLAQDAYVTSAVIKPQRSTIVHHVILFEASGANAVDARRLNNASGGNGWTCFGGPGLSETHPTSDSASNDRLGAPPWISAWVPGHTTNDTPSGTGVLVHAGAAIVMQVHYNLIHKAQRDRSRAIIRFAPAATKLTPLETILVPAPVELPCPRGVQSALCSREVAVQQEIKKYGYNAALIPSGLLYLCGKSLDDYPSNPASVKSLSTRLRPARHSAASDLRRGRPHAHARLRHQGPTERTDAAAHPALELPLAGRLLPRTALSTRTSATRSASAASSTTRRFASRS